MSPLTDGSYFSEYVKLRARTAPHATCCLRRRCSYRCLVCGSVRTRFDGGSRGANPCIQRRTWIFRETASLDFQLALQVRNKLVEAYQDVMRMQV